MDIAQGWANTVSRYMHPPARVGVAIAEKFFHATGFILKPDGVVASAVYSTGPIGRFTAADALAVVNFLSKK